MTLDAWLAAAAADAERRGLADLKPLLEALARSTAVLRSADFNDNAAGTRRAPPLADGHAAARPAERL
jgi:hypothetical protein